MSDTKNLFSLFNRVAVVTGGMGQLGMAYACALVDHGARVAVFDLRASPRYNDERFNKAVRDGSIRAFCVDITSREELSDSITTLQSEWGVPDILVNNAALDSPPDAEAEDVGPFESYPEKSFDKVMEVNAKGAFLCCQVIGGAMASAGRGTIINISSIYGILSPCQDVYEYQRKAGRAFFKPVAYSVSKSSILNLTRYLATYWAEKGVRVNTLTLAGVFNDQPREFLDSYCLRVPMRRMAEADEMVGAIIFLASDASSYMTGANLIVDGGWSAW